MTISRRGQYFLLKPLQQMKYLSNHEVTISPGDKISSFSFYIGASFHYTPFSLTSFEITLFEMATNSK